MRVILPWSIVEFGRTGKRRYRIGWFQKVVLQVEVNIHVYHRFGTRRDVSTLWRDALPAEVGLPTVCMSTPTFLSIAHDGILVEQRCEE